MDDKANFKMATVSPAGESLAQLSLSPVFSRSKMSLRPLPPFVFYYFSLPLRSVVVKISSFFVT